jgi:nucleoside-diphosphate-sugar epimerase
MTNLTEAPTGNISVFGGTGFIGSRFIELYKQSSIKIDRNSYVPRSNQILYLTSTVDNYNIHKDLHIDIDTNLRLLMNVLENIDRTDKNLVFNFVSSWFVYGKNQNTPFKENDLMCNPTGFYSITKRCAEQLLISFCETFDIKYRIFRLANVIGEGDLKISKQKNALQFLIKEIVHGKDVELYYGGNVIRDYIYVDDVCHAIHHCLENGAVNQIINIGSGIPYLFLDIIKKTIEYSNSPSKIIEINSTHFHDVVQVKDSHLDITKLTSMGYQQQFDIDTTIKKLINHYRITG